MTAIIDGKEETWTNTYDGEDSDSSSASTEATTTAPSVAASSTPATSIASQTSSAASSTSTADSSGFCTKRKRATTEEIAYTGDTGECGWGSNIIQIASDEISSYDYTLNFVNDASSDVLCQCTNKIGRDGEVDGFFETPAISFTLSASDSQAVAFQSDSQGECMCAEGSSVPTSVDGEYLGSWVEFDFDNSSNDGYSGLDISVIAAETYASTYPSMKVCVNDECSSVSSAGVADNAYTTANTDSDGIGLNLAPGNVAGTVTISS